MRHKLPIAGAMVVALSFATSASAGISGNDLVLSVTVGPDSSEWVPGGGPNPNGNGWGYHGNRNQNHSQGGSWSLEWDISASRADEEDSTDRGSQTAFLFNNIVLTNNTGMTQDVVVTTMVPVVPAIVPSSVMGGSASGTLSTNSDGGTMGHLNGADPMYRALIDALAVGGLADLHNFDSTISVVGFGSDSTGFEDFGTPIPSAPGPAVLSSIGITLQFTLTPGDSVSWTSSFVVNIPAPGAGAVFGLAGVLAMRRRR